MTTVLQDLVVSPAVTREPSASLAVVGIGNVLLGDDAFGPTVLEMLAAGWEVPDGVDLVDAGTPGLDLAGLVGGRRALILVDAVAAQGQPGDLLVYRGAELDGALAIQVRVSPHDPAVAEALAIARLAGEAPEHVVLVGVVPAGLEVGLGLSAPVSVAAPQAAALVATIAAELGAPMRRRADAQPARPWWFAEDVATPGRVPPHARDGGPS